MNVTVENLTTGEPVEITPELHQFIDAYVALWCSRWKSRPQHQHVIPEMDLLVWFRSEHLASETSSTTEEGHRPARPN
jgi:hypothetical protein